jgi:thymidylate kinase
MAAAEPGRWLVLDARRTIEAIQEDIRARVRGLLEGAGNRHPERS